MYIKDHNIMARIVRQIQSHFDHKWLVQLVLLILDLPTRDISIVKFSPVCIHTSLL